MKKTPPPCSQEDRRKLRRHALTLGARWRDLVSGDDQQAIADLAAVLAARRFDAARDKRFVAYARPWVEGLLWRAVRRELAARRKVAALRARREPAVDESFFERAAGRDLLRRLPEEARELAFDHGMAERSLAEVARRAGRHRAWAHRRWREVRQLAEALAT